MEGVARGNVGGGSAGDGEECGRGVGAAALLAGELEGDAGAHAVAGVAEEGDVGTRA